MAKLRIELRSQDACTIKSPHYRATSEAREFEKMEVDKLLLMNVIEPAESEWKSPIVFTPKKDGSLRFRIHYRKLKDMTVRDA